MSLFDKWWDAANSQDRSRMAELLDDSFTFIRHNTGEELNKDEFIDYLMTGIRDQVTAHGRRLIYENDQIIVSHSVLDGPMGKNAVMLVRLVKDGKIIRQETGSTPVVLPTAPSQNTQSKTKVAAQLAAPPAGNTRSRGRKSLIPVPSAIPSTNIWRLTRRMKRIKNEVHKALAVMDKDAGKMLNYRQLMQHPDYKQQ